LKNLRTFENKLKLLEQKITQKSEKSLKGPEEEDVVVTFKESLDKKENEDLKDTLETTEAIAEQQEILIEVNKVNAVGPLKD
jgi:hypothetical protein